MAGLGRRIRPHEIAFTPLRRWYLPRTQTEYPVPMRIRAGTMELVPEPSMDGRELGSRASTGTICRQGAVQARDGARFVGQG